MITDITDISTEIEKIIIKKKKRLQIKEVKMI